MAHEISPTHSKKDFKKTIKQTNNQKKEKGYFFGTAREEYMSVSSVDYCGGMAIINGDGALCVIMTIMTSIWTVMMMDGQVL